MVSSAEGGGAPRPVSFLGSLSRSQLAASAATGLDYAVLFGLVELAHVWYVLAVSIGAAAGAVVNFALNRHWSFRAQHDAWRSQAGRYAAVSAGSLALNTFGSWVVTEKLHVPYGASVIAVAMLIALVFNFPLQKYYVFR